MRARRIINFGNTSHVISLPKKWMERNNLEKGDYLNVEERLDQLVIHSGNNGKDKFGYVHKINLNEYDYTELEKIIISGYINGAVLFELYHDNISQKVMDLKKIFQKVSGFEISFQNSTNIVYQDIINYDKFNLKDILKRLDYIIREMFEDLKNIKNKKDCEILFQKFIDLKRTYFLIYRITHLFSNNPKKLEELDVNINEFVENFQVLKNIRNICKICVDIGFAIYDYSLSGQENRTYLNYLNKSKTIYTNLMKSYYLNNFKLVNQTFEETKGMEFKLIEQSEQTKNQYLNRIYLSQIILIDTLKDLANTLMNKIIQKDLIPLD